MKPVKCDPVYLQMARAALIEKLKPRLEPVLSDLGGIRSVSGFKDPEFISVPSAQAWTDSRTPNWSIRRWRC